MFWTHRINRATYWLFVGCVVVFSIMLGIFASQTFSAGEVVWILICVPRLHDIGRSGWWVAAPLGIEVVVGLAAALTLKGLQVEIAFGVTLSMLGLIAWLGSVKGDAGANQFGEAPHPGINVQGRGPGQAA